MPLHAPGAPEVKAEQDVTDPGLPTGGEQEEEQEANEPGSRARSRSRGSDEEESTMAS